MSRNCHREGDANSGGGVLNFMTQYTVFVNGKPKSIVGDRGSGHGRSPHGSLQWATAGGSSTVYASFGRVIRRGDTDTCGHSRVGGSPNVFVG